MNYKYMSRTLGCVEKIMFRTALNQFNATTLAYQAEKLPFFTFVLSHLSENYKTIFMWDEHCDQSLLSKDVLNLRIISTHTVPTTTSRSHFLEWWTNRMRHDGEEIVR
jgi:hypothetical protein